MNNSNKDLPKICILVGPTAVGKTDISLGLAEKLNCEIISADSAQVYKYMDIGTAKIKPEEMKGIKHYMIDEVYPDESFSVAEFNERAQEYIKEVTARGKLPLIAGGTGLYIESLLNNLDFTPAVGNDDFRNYLSRLAEEKGNEYVHELLKDKDMTSYEKLHPNNLRRVIRALEVFEFTGKPISEFQEESKKQPPKYNYVYVGLTMDRAKLYERIEKRVEIMLQKGLIEEVKGLLDRGYHRGLNSMQALGYKEIASYIYGECTLSDAVTILKRDSRHYAKRQLTWFRRNKDIYWVDTDLYENRGIIIENITKYVAGKIILL